MLGAELPSSQVPSVAAHVAECSACKGKLRGIKASLVGPTLWERGRPEGERRKEYRLTVDEPASMRQLSPLLAVRWEVRILDVSKNGMRIEVPERLDPGTVVQIRLLKSSTIITAEVRHCQSMGDGYQVGVEIQDVFPTGGGAQNPPES